MSAKFIPPAVDKVDWSVSAASDLDSMELPNEKQIEELLNWNVERIVNLSDGD